MNPGFFLDTNASKQGVYLSQQQIDLLFIVACNDKNQLENYFYKMCGQFPYQKIEDVIPNYQHLEVEEAKRVLFARYQEILIGYKEVYRMSMNEQAMAKLGMMRTPDGKTIPEEVKIETVRRILNGSVDEGFGYLSTIYGLDFVLKFNRLMKDDFENIKSISYDDVVALHERIKNDSRIDTIIIATSKYDNSVFSDGEKYYYDPYFTSKGLAYCKMTVKHMRFHAIFDYAHLKNLVESGKGLKDREQILRDMKAYVKLSLDYIRDYNNSIKGADIPPIRVVEVFNELVEYNKEINDSLPYQMAWEKYFGITVDDILSCFDGIEKPDGVEFMYNETQLEEHPDRRREVDEVLSEIMQKRPDLIDVFGNQMHLQHTHAEESSHNPNDSLEAVRESLLLMADIESRRYEFKDKEGNIVSKKLRTEITEFDIHICKETYLERIIPMLKSGELTESDIIFYKETWMKTISDEIIKSGISPERITYWTLHDIVDHNLVRANQAIMKNNPNMSISELEQFGMFVDTLYAGALGTGNAQKQLVPISSPNQVVEKSDLQHETTLDISDETPVSELSQEMDKSKVLSLKHPTIPNSGFITEYIILAVILTVLLTLVILTVITVM